MRLKVRAPSGDIRTALSVDLPLEFEGKRAFIIWDSVTVGDYQFLARIEINPRYLKKIRGRTSDYAYTRELSLPRPQDN